MSIPSHEDRCIGCLLGVACGDILGASIEGWRASEIREIYGQLRNFEKSQRGFGCYTDDTQMTLALVVSLLEQGRVEAGAVSTKYAEFYEPWRGYGGGAQVVMHALKRELDYRATGRMQFPEGSFANGGAMRIAPVGLAYRHAPEECVIRAANFGGDTDTIGAMAGAVAGALHGSGWIPSRWYDNIENSQRGRDEIVKLARELSRLDIAAG